VQEHGGSIQLQSEPGKGTAVTVIFPEWTPDTPAAEAPLRANGMKPIQPDLSS